MSINNGGPAFPVNISVTVNGEMGDSEKFVQQWNGMTLRDYFAAKAMQGLFANSDTSMIPDGLTERTVVICAQVAYEMADAMLAERGKGE